MIWESDAWIAGGESRTRRARCKAARKNTSWGALEVSGVAAKAWSSSHGSAAMRFGEAEYCLSIAGGRIVWHPRSDGDLGWVLKVRLHADCSAPKVVSGRVGLTWARHIEMQLV